MRLLALLAFLLATPAFAGSGTIAITPGTGATIATTTDGSSNNLSHGVTCDQSAGASCQSVKAASTAAVAGDQAAVVAISPNNTVGVTGTFWQTTQPVSIAAAPVASGDIIVTPSSSFTRPANTTVYTVNTVVANSTTAGSVVFPSWTVTRANAGNSYVRRAVMVTTNHTLATAGNFVLYLFTGTVAPTTAAGDDVAFSAAVTLVNEFCAIPITLTEKGSDDSIGRGAPDIGSECNFVAGAGVSTIWGLLTVTSAYTPISAEVEKLILEVHEN